MTCLVFSLPLPPLAHTPRFSVEKVASVAKDLYGVRGTVAQLPSERDQNFQLTHQSGHKFVLRIANGLEDPAILDAQNRISQHLSGIFPYCQRLIASRHGKYLEEVVSSTGRTHFVRLNSYLPGVPLAEIESHSPGLLEDFGHKLGLLDKALLRFDHPAIHRKFHWDLAQWESVVSSHCELVQNTHLRTAISNYALDFAQRIAPMLRSLRLSCIHGDANDYNILVDPGSLAVVGFIDFGDTIYSYTVGDLAIALAYVALNNESPLESATHVVKGYTQTLPLEENELSVVWPLMLMRLCMSVCLAAYQQSQQPDNDYLEISQTAIQRSLPGLLSIDLSHAASTLYVRT